MKNLTKIAVSLLILVYPLFSQSNEEWVKYERNGKGFGYEHIEVFELEDGNTRYDIQWCEVWLGEWLAVDPSNGIFIVNPSHIKFTDSPSLLGHQTLWWRLVDNLRIQVLEFNQ